MNRMELSKVVEQYARHELADEKMKVVRIADSKTVYVETIGEMGRSIIFNEYKVDGDVYWAGYSVRSDTVFVSQVTRR